MSTVEQPIIQVLPEGGETPSRRSMLVSGIRAPVDDGLSESNFDYAQFATLAGPLTSPPTDRPYRVRYHGIHKSKSEWLLTRVIALALVALDVGFIYWLIFKSRYPDLGGWLWRGSLHGGATDGRILLLAGMAFGSIVMQLFLLTNGSILTLGGNPRHGLKTGLREH
jgi:hypothetical protein